MSRDERYGTRSLAYSRWHRFTCGDMETMIDIDAIEYCGERGCNKPLAVIETALDVGQDNKVATVVRILAKALDVTGLVVLYRVSDIECACPDSRNLDPDCAHGIAGFRVRVLHRSGASSPGDWCEMTPDEYHRALWGVRMRHFKAAHPYLI